MKLSPINSVVVAASVALITLILFQVKWLNQSRSMIEKQFDQKVQMALCSFVEACATDSSLATSCQKLCDSAIVLDATFCQNIESKMALYKVDMDYSIHLLDSMDVTSESIPVHSSVMPNVKGLEDKILALQFPKSAYVARKMGFMLFSSLFIVLIISSVFIYAIRAMIKQRRLHEINKDFFNNMAHEFKTPLTTVSLATKLLDKSEPNLSENSYFRILRKEHQKLNQQVDQMLTLAAVENGDYKLSKSWFSPVELVQTLIKDLDLQLKDHRAKVRLKANDGVDKVFADPKHIYQALRNLIINSLKYCNCDPVIDIRIDKDDKGVWMSFIDNGVGIPVQDQQLIFQRFKRNHTETNGYGLGLHYVKYIVELHQGFVRIVNDLTRGTHFDVFIPSPQGV